MTTNKILPLIQNSLIARRAPRHICTAMILAAGLTTQVYGAPISYPTAGGTYSQDFNSLPTTISSGTQLLLAAPASPVELTGVVSDGPRNMTFSGTDGWYMSQTGSNLVYTPLINLATAVPGASGTPALPSPQGSVYTFATAAAPTDKSLGLSAGTNIERFGAIFVNNTGGTLNKFTLSFTTEQYIDGATSTNTMTFNYAVGGTNINTGTFVAASALNMLSPLASTPGTTTYIDGNAVGNKTAVTSTVSGLTWVNGTNLVVRWSDINESGVDDGLGIDDLSFSANVTVPYVWNSGSFSGAQTWDTVVGPPQQWLAPGAADFANGETAEFSQNNGATVNITVAAGVTPAATIISSNTDTYTFGGAAIGGGTLTKSGAGTATFNAANSFSGVSVSGGLLQATVANAMGATAPITLSGGTLETQVGSAAGTAAISLNGGTLKISTVAQSHANTLTVGASGGTVQTDTDLTLTANPSIAAANTLTKTGSAVLVINGASGFAGIVDVQAGTVRASTTGDLAAGTSLIKIASSATFDETRGDGETWGSLADSGGTGDGTVGNPTGTGGTGGTYLALSGAANGHISIGADNRNVIFSGKITAGLLNTHMEGASDSERTLRSTTGLTKTGTGVQTLTSSTSNFSAQVKATNGTLAFGNIANRGSASALGVGNLSNIGSAIDITLGSGGNAATLSYTGATLNSTDRTLALAGTGALTLNVASATGILRLDGVVSSTSTPSSFTKTGPGTLELTAANLYLGNTTVGAGTLLANNTTGSATDGGNVTVDPSGAGGATLGGTGIITGSVTVKGTNGVGRLSPGASIESLATGTVDLQNNTALVYEASPGDANFADLLDITGNLTLTGSVALDLAGADLANPAWGLVTISIASYTGTWNSGTFAGWADDSAQLFGGNSWTINYDDLVAGINFTSEQVAAGSPNHVTLTQTVPEPSAALSLLGGSALLLGLRRRRS